MKALLSIQLAEASEKVGFQSTYENQIKLRYPKIHSFSLDNFSDAAMVAYAQELIQQSEDILILVESHHSQASPNKLLKLFNRLVKERFQKGKIVLIGKNALLEKMIQVLGKSFIKQPKAGRLDDIVGNLFA